MGPLRSESCFECLAAGYKQQIMRTVFYLGLKCTFYLVKRLSVNCLYMCIIHRTMTAMYNTVS